MRERKERETERMRVRKTEKERYICEWEGGRERLIFYLGGD